MKKICGLLLIVLTLASMLIAGCSKEANLKENTMPANGIIRISPSTLFEGDTKKLEPHLGLISGCVNVKYSGPKKFIQTSYEIWEEGKLKKTSNLVGSLIQSNRSYEYHICLPAAALEEYCFLYGQSYAPNGRIRKSRPKPSYF